MSLIITGSTRVFAQNYRENNRPNYFYNLDFEYIFDNREFDASKSQYTPSSTIHGVRLTPTLGINVNNGKHLNNSLIAGIDIKKDMGDGLENKELFREILLYWNLKYHKGRSLFEMNAGVFPRKESLGTYTRAFLSDSLKWYDNNIEGLILKLHRPKSYYEAGLDWCGQRGPGRRERFIVFSFGESRLTNWLNAGWRFNLYHYANCLEYKGLVDNALCEPFIKFHYEDFFDKCELELGYLKAYQRDRRVGKAVDYPGGLDLGFLLSKWNIYLSDRFYWGNSLMPYYYNLDAGNNMYGSDLYRGDGFYKIYTDLPNESEKIGTYNRLEGWWEPNIGRKTHLRVGAAFHFNNGKFSGWQQKLSIIYIIDGKFNESKKFNHRSTSNRNGMHRDKRW